MKKRKMHLKDYSVDKTWTLFLDRDGVINERLPGNYVRKPDEFHFLTGAKEAIAAFTNIFGRIVVVTNQQGIGKGLMTVDELMIVHIMMLEDIEAAGGRIDKIYFSPHLEEENSQMRKPNTGMALHAKKDFPEIDFSRSVMVGDSMHDMEFGKRLGMKCVFIFPDAIKGNELVDFRFSSLAEFSRYMLGS